MLQKRDGAAHMAGPGPYTVDVAKNPTKERSGRDGGVQRITTVDNPDQTSPVLFVAVLGAILLAGLVGVFFFASNRESNIDVAPVAAVDHWHVAYLINNCGADLPASSQFNDPDGLHTHGDGVFHLHPTNPSASGRNATLGEYFEGANATLTDSEFVTGTNDLFPTTMTEEVGCDGQPATLQLAVWDNAFDETAEPRILTENLADFRFAPGQAITLALLPEGEEPPRPPADRIAALAESGAGGPITGVEPGENPIVTTTTEAPPADTDADAETDADADGGADAEGGADADGADATEGSEDADGDSGE